MGYAQKKLSSLGQITMCRAYLADLFFAANEKKPLDVGEHFECFLRVLDQMLDDDMVLDIKSAIADILP